MAERALGFGLALSLAAATAVSLSLSACDQDDLGFGECLSDDELESLTACPRPGLRQGNPAVSGVADLDAYFELVVDIRAGAAGTTAFIRGDLERLAAALDVDVPEERITEASLPELAQAISTTLNEVFERDVNGVVASSDTAPVCTSTFQSALRFVRACDQRVDEPVFACGSCRDAACRTGCATAFGVADDGTFSGPLCAPLVPAASAIALRCDPAPLRLDYTLDGALTPAEAEAAGLRLSAARTAVADLLALREQGASLLDGAERLRTSRPSVRARADEIAASGSVERSAGAGCALESLDEIDPLLTPPLDRLEDAMAAADEVTSTLLGSP